MDKVWMDKAPSNIALIKYMGKDERAGNQALNPTLSYTLNHLLTEVHLTSSPDGEDHFEPLPGSELKLSAQQEMRFLNFLKGIKAALGYEGHFMVKSTNNFPSDCGLASSASSFAALTKVAVKAICEIQEKPLPPNIQQAQLSRLGSGSSCRSFFSPWSYWSEDRLSEVTLPYTELRHMVFIVNQSVKKVSSSEAHKRVISSSLFEGRTLRAKTRLAELLDAFRAKDWQRAYEICWAEFWDMHALFETSTPSFGYMVPDTLKILNWIRDYWKMIGDGPIVTMDAGPNVHFLFRPNQKEMMDNMYAKWSSEFKIMSY